MCGITGLWELSEAIGRAGSAEETARAMADRLAHRGPDDAGTWAEAEVGVALGHRRLSIIDLSREGHQPMVSACGRFVVVFNGEVYNHRGLHDELENLGQTFRGASDTEVVVAGISQWGLCEAVRRFNGMFALGVWDRRRRVLSLVRDRLGIKPLFYGFIDDGFVFASEVKALTGHPGFRREIEREAVPLFFRYGYVPAPHSIYRGIAALPPATILELDVKGLEDRQPGLTRFWSVEEVLRRGARGPETVEEAATEVE
ncbi:MAG: asparagine synthetase B, partial [Gemmatimonadetes bacterium]|nr:asparagine synthetase B [Gemmatimonadota bacterium]